MKKVLILLAFTGHLTFAQSEKMGKAEKKELVARAKKFKSNPQSLKSFLQEMESLKATQGEMRKQLTQSQDQVSSLREGNENLQSENRRLVSELDNAREKHSQTKTEAITKGYRLPLNATVFRVQIGGYRKRALADMIDNSSENIQVETNDLGIEEITVGQFSEYGKANELKKHLRAMGVKDAWIVPFKNGQRVLLKEVLDELRKTN